MCFLFSYLNPGSSEIVFSTRVSLFLVLSLSLDSVSFQFHFRIFFVVISLSTGPIFFCSPVPLHLGSGTTAVSLGP